MKEKTNWKAALKFWRLDMEIKEKREKQKKTKVTNTKIEINKSHGDLGNERLPRQFQRCLGRKGVLKWF